jgi:hypothetical protein
MRVDLKADRNDSVLRDQVIAKDRLKRLLRLGLVLVGRPGHGTVGYPE